MQGSLKTAALLPTFFLILFLTPGILIGARTVPAATDDLQGELDSINLQIDFLKLKVKQNSGQIGSLEKKISGKKKEISELEQQIISLNEKQIRHTEQIDKMQTDLKVGQEQMLQLLTRFRARLVQLHKIKQGTL
ncbi:MAG: hypothetical protein AB1403_23535, partial [Candidatus Riflebacteria bacterium]